MNPRSSPVWATALWISFALLIPNTIVRAEESSAALLRLVPEDAAFCLVVRDLRGHSKAFLASPFARHFPSTRLGKALLDSDEVKQLRQFGEHLEQHLGLSPEGLREEILGDTVVLAFRQGQGDPPGPDQGLILLRARQAKVLADFITRLNAVQKASGEVKELEERRHAGHGYTRRAEAKGDTFYAIHGPLLVFSSQELMVREALQRLATPGGPSLADRCGRIGADGALAQIWVNPRVFDAEMEKNAARAHGTEAAAQKTLVGFWKALEGANVSLHPGDDVRIRLTLRGRAEVLPESLRVLGSTLLKPSRLWQRFPEEALVTMAGQLPLAALLRLVGECLDEPGRRALHETLERHLGDPSGRGAVAEILPSLGPDFGLCVLPASKGFWPEAAFILRVQSGQGTPSMDRAVLSAVTFYAQMATFVNNRTHKAPLRFRTEISGALEIRFLTGGDVFPAGVQPAFALHDGFLYLGTTPGIVRKLALAPERPSEPGTPLLLRLQLLPIQRWLSHHRNAFAENAATREGLPTAEALRRLDDLLGLLELADRVELGVQGQGDEMSLTLRIVPRHSLR